MELVTLVDEVTPPTFAELEATRHELLAELQALVGSLSFAEKEGKGWSPDHLSTLNQLADRAAEGHCYRLAAEIANTPSGAVRAKRARANTAREGSCLLFIRAKATTQNPCNLRPKCICEERLKPEKFDSSFHLTVPYPFPTSSYPANTQT